MAGYYFTTSLDDDDDFGAAPDVTDVDEHEYYAAAESNGIELGRRIANGNFGLVYYGVLDQSTEVCVKFLKPARSQKEHDTQVKNFQREAGLMSELRHPNIMELVLAGTEPFMFIVTKFMSRGNLFHLIHSGTIQNDIIFVKIVCDVAHAMAYLHACDPPVVHRDLTSPNVLIADDFSARVSDFGLAKIKHPALLPSGQRGNLAWLAPETLHQCSFEPPSDVYSFGIILWEVTTKQVPFAGCSRREVEASKRAGNSPGALPEAIPDEFGQLIAVCLHVNPELRPTFAQLYACLDALIKSVDEDEEEQEDEEQEEQEEEQ